MQHRRSIKLLALPVAAALALAACGSDAAKSGDTSPPQTTVAATTATTAGSDTTDASADTTTAGTAGATDTTAASDTSDTASGGAGASADLAAVCPSEITILTDWNPEAEHGFLYNLIDPKNYKVDTKEVSVSGPLVAPGGGDTGVTLKVRSGGPAIGYQTVTSQLYADDNILLGYVYTDEAIQNSAEFPTVAIESGFEKNPQMIMWDPATYPQVKTIADLGKTGAIVRYFSGAAYMDYFTSQGILSPDQVDGSYDGTPALFVADQGKAAQQGFGSAEPYVYEHEVAEWGKPVSYAYINDAGWENYAESIATKPGNITKYAKCFAALVPMIQQSSIDYLKDPAATNAMIIDAVNQFDNGWVYSEGVADYAVKTIKDDGLVANGPDDILGNFDLDRVNSLIQKAIPVYTSLNQPPKEGLTADDIVTNQFIDESIGL